MREILPISNYYFDGKSFVLNQPKKNWLRLLFLVIVFFVSLSYFGILNDYTYESRKEIVEVAIEKENKLKDALSLYIKSVKSDITDKEADKISSSAIKWGEYFKLDPVLILAVAKHESTFDKKAKSKMGAIGLMQVMPRWHRDKMMTAQEIFGTNELHKVEPNIYVGAKILRDCKDRFKHIRIALKCYNGSLGSSTKYDSVVLDNKKEIEFLIKNVSI